MDHREVNELWALLKGNSSRINLLVPILLFVMGFYHSDEVNNVIFS